MSKILISILTLLVSVAAYGEGEELRSPALRKSMCQALEMATNEAGMKSVYDHGYRGDIEPIPNFVELCEKSVGALIVVDQEIHPQADTTFWLEISIDLYLEDLIEFQGTISLGRTVWDPSIPAVSKGPWKVISKDLSFQLGDLALRRLGEAMALSASYGNGDVKVGRHFSNPNDLSKEKGELFAEVIAFNSDHGKDCQMEVLESAESQFYALEDRWGDEGQARQIYEFLKSNGYVKEVIGSGVLPDYFSEFCAFWSLRVYLSNGQEIVIDYDHTT